MASMQVPSGTVVDQRFRILERIGSGGMGDVFEAEQVDLGRVVAVKLLNERDLADQESLTRFQREAKIISQLKHRNIVSVYAFGVWRKLPYMALERVQGCSLQHYLSANEPLDQAFVLDLGMQVCSGLAAAHDAGVVHRDIKPHNLILADNGDVKIIDFGLAKVTAPREVQLTEAGTTLGTVLYMSPEQVRCETVDARCDVYALGCVLHHCLTGVAPFVGESAITVMTMQVNHTAPRLAQVQPSESYPESLQTLLDIAMAKDASDRYQCAAQMKEDLQVVARGGTIEKGEERERNERRQKRVSNWTPPVPALAVVALAIVGVSAWLWIAQPPSAVQANNDNPGLKERVKQLEALVSNDPDHPAAAAYHAEAAQIYRTLGLEQDSKRHAVAAIESARSPEEKTQLLTKLNVALIGKDNVATQVNAINKSAKALVAEEKYKQARAVYRNLLVFASQDPSGAAREAIEPIIASLLACDNKLLNTDDLQEDLKWCTQIASQLPTTTPEENKRKDAILRALSNAHTQRYDN
jgi:tRNA A-37 threonylcarbamoyl transferase component Bud32/tetratricopeptide (TPR) repeat protein